MASPQTRQVLQDLRKKNGNNVSEWRPAILCQVVGPLTVLVLLFVSVGVLRVRRAQPPVGIGHVRRVHMSGVLGEAQGSGSSQEVHGLEGSS